MTTDVMSSLIFTSAIFKIGRDKRQIIRV